MDAVIIQELSKGYGPPKSRTEALKSISLSVHPGELFGLIGPDGAGKTTLFRILTTLLLPDSGNAQVDGLDVQQHFREIRNRVGYMPGKFSLYPDLTVEENLEFFATIFNTRIQQNYDLIRDIYEQIAPFKNRRAGQLSGGMKQKLALSCALIHRPSVLFLDEPTTGVDAVSRKEFWEMLGRLKEQGITILVSTPYMDEASRCDRVALMQEGQIMDMDCPTGIIQRFDAPLRAIRGPHMLELLNEARAQTSVAAAYPFGSVHHVVLHPDAPEPEWPEGVEAFAVEPDIEDCFMELMRNQESQTSN